MGSISDFYTTQGGNVPGALANIGMSRSDAGIDAGLAQSRLLSNYSTRQLPGVVNSNAARGTFYGGSAGVEADRLKEDVGNQYVDIQQQLNRHLANLRRQGVLAATGMVL